MPKNSEPKIAGTQPVEVTLEKGKRYFFCSCGRSAKQPYCDGSHSGSNFTPVKYEAAETKQVFFCGCKHTQNAPLCDGSHSKI